MQQFPSLNDKRLIAKCAFFSGMMVIIFCLFIVYRFFDFSEEKKTRYLRQARQVQDFILQDLKMLESVLAINKHSDHSFIRIPRGIRQSLTIYVPTQFYMVKENSPQLISEGGIFLENASEFRIEKRFSGENKTKKVIARFQDNKFLHKITEILGEECFLYNQAAVTQRDEHTIFKGGNFVINCGLPHMPIEFFYFQYKDFIYLFMFMIAGFNLFLFFIVREVDLKFKELENLLSGCIKTMNTIEAEMCLVFKGVAKQIRCFSSYLKTGVLLENQEAFVNLCDTLDRFNSEQLCDPIVEESADFITILDKAVDLNAYFISQKNIKIVKKISAEARQLRCNVMILTRITASLLYRSVEFSKKKGDIVVRAYIRGGHIILFIQDLGYRISEETEHASPFKLTLKAVSNLALEQNIKLEVRRLGPLGNISRMQIPLKKVKYSNVVPLFKN